MRQPRWWALISGLTGLVANLLLILFFALAQPWRSTFSDYGWLGTANDWMIVVQFTALVPVALALGSRLRGDRLVRIATASAVAVMATIVALQLLLVGNRLDFGVQGPLVTLCFALIFVWAAVISRRGYRAGELPSTVARFATLMGLLWAAGAAVLTLALLLPSGSVVQYLGFGLGLLAGATGWLAFPVWTLLLARHWPTAAMRDRRAVAMEPRAGTLPDPGGTRVG